jgi:hypothetical protein
MTPTEDSSALLQEQLPLIFTAAVKTLQEAPLHRAGSSPQRTTHTMLQTNDNWHICVF